MKTEEILDLDYRIAAEKKILCKALHKIPPLAECDVITMEDLEKVIGSITRKYAIMIQYICPTYIKKNDDMYCVSIKTTDTEHWLGNVYGCCLYEAMAKTAIKMYAEVRREKVKLASENKRERRRSDEIADLY